jgi:hypothetical protein
MVSAQGTWAKTTTARRVIGLTVVWVLWLTPVSLSDDPSARVFKVGKHAGIALSIPETLEVESQSTDEGVLSIRVVPREGSLFEILISAVAVPRGAEAMSSPEFTKYLVHTRGTALLETAVETELGMMEVSGTRGVGYFFALTDKREELPPDEFKYLCQGVMPLGGIQLSATLLSNSPGNQPIIQLLEMLRTADTTTVT